MLMGAIWGFSIFQGHVNMLTAGTGDPDTLIGICLILLQSMFLNLKQGKQ